MTGFLKGQLSSMYCTYRTGRTRGANSTLKIPHKQNINHNRHIDRDKNTTRKQQQKKKHNETEAILLKDTTVDLNRRGNHMTRH